MVLAAVLEVAQDGEEAAVVGLGGLKAELLEDARHVLLDRALGDDETLHDPGIREPFGNEREDLALSSRAICSSALSPTSEDTGHPAPVSPAVLELQALRTCPLRW
jgi:hypothetical protein